MVRQPLQVIILALLLVLAIPVQSAFACSIAIRRLGPVDITKKQLVRPTSAVVDRAVWKRDRSWRDVRPRLEQFVRITGGYTEFGVAYPKQRALSLDAYGPEDTGWMYFDDGIAETPPCTMVGAIEWQLPRISVQQGRTEIHILASSQRTVGNRAGCLLGPDTGVRPCPNLARTVVLLKQPIGTRTIVFDSFSTVSQ